jgi:hypothetical protein
MSFLNICSEKDSMNVYTECPETSTENFWGHFKGEIFLLSTSSRPVLGSTQPPIQWGLFLRGSKATGP